MLKTVALGLAVVAISTAQAKAGPLEDALAKLDPQERSHQACIMKGIDMMRHDARLKKADRMKTQIFAPAVLDKTQLTGEGDVFHVRARQRDPQGFMGQTRALAVAGPCHRANGEASADVGLALNLYLHARVYKGADLHEGGRWPVRAEIGDAARVNERAFLDVGHEYLDLGDVLGPCARGFQALIHHIHGDLELRRGVGRDGAVGVHTDDA
jgi:hypothetical protein